MRIYISIPITDKDEATQRRKANEVKRQIEAKGHEAVNPFDVYDELCTIHRHIRKLKPTYNEIMIEDLAALTGCHSIVLCEGCTLSKGCGVEYNHAKELELKIIDEKELHKIKINN